MKYKLNIKRMEKLGYFILPVALILFATSKISLSSFIYGNSASKIEFFKPVMKKLLERGADTNFVESLISDSRTKFNEKYISINVTGYLKKPDYSQNYSQLSVQRARLFLEEHASILKKCENKYGVPGEMISSILWIETRYGSYLGNNHVPSVFLSTAMAGEPEYVLLNKKLLRDSYKADSAEYSPA